MTIYRSFFLIGVLSAAVVSQAQTNNRLSWWPGYYLRYTLSGRWSVNSDVQVRNLSKSPLVGLVAFRTGAQYRFAEHYTVTTGVAWFHQRRVNEAKEEKSNEFRVWQELKHEYWTTRWRIANSFRTEQRFWKGEGSRAFRHRYRLGVDYEVSLRWKVIGGTEIMWQNSRQRKDWDQYRLWLGGEYSLDPANQLQLLFMNWWQFNNNIYQPVIRINFIQTINARHERNAGDIKRRSSAPKS